MEDEKNDLIRRKFEQRLDKFLSSKRLRKIIKKSLNENPPELDIKAKGKERAHEITERIKSQSNRLDNLYHEYLHAAEQARKNKKLSTEDKLKNLISPLKEIQEILIPDYLDKDLGYHQFVDDGYIDLENELDWKQLVSNNAKYGIVSDIELKHLGHLNTRRRNIWLSDQYERYLIYCRDVKPVSESEFDLWKCDFCGKADWSVSEIKGQHCCSDCWDKLPPAQLQEPQVRLNSLFSPIVYPPSHKSISEIWPDWLPALNQESMGSNDWLTQILVCYTIKRALNQDNKAFKKLYVLYEEAVKRIVIREILKFAERMCWAISKKFRLHKPIDVRVLLPPKKDMEQDIESLLTLILKGFSPENILRQILTKDTEDPIKALPKWVQNFFIYYLSIHVPQKMEELQRKAERMKLLEEAPVFEVFDFGVQLISILNPYAPIQDSTLWKGTPKRKNRFNNYSFIPGAVSQKGVIIRIGLKNNLTLWLLGTPTNRQYGKLYQLLRDRYKPIIMETLFTINDDFVDDFDEDRKKALSFNERKEALDSRIDIEEDAIQKDRIEKIIECLPKKDEQDKRNAKIFRQWILKELTGEGLTQTKIAKQYGLSVRHIKRICHDCKKFIPRALLK